MQNNTLLLLPGPELRINPKARCHNCTEELFGPSSSRVSLRCEECPDLELCPECWASRAELSSHSPLHAYRLIDSGSYPLLEGSCPSSDHIRLLDAVEQFGYGNWEDIAACIPGMGPTEAKKEYTRSFVEESLGSQTWSRVTRGSALDHTSRLQPTRSEPPPNLSLTESIMLGFMPQREDYEVEYDNGCESLVSHLGLGPLDEDEVETALKTSHVDIYTYRLNERERRKRVVREHGLIGQFFKESPVSPNGSGGGGSIGDHHHPLSFAKKANGLKARKGGGVIPKDPFGGRLKALAEFLGPKEFNSFMSNIAKEKELRQQIKDYQKYRRNGITKVSDSMDYDNMRVRMGQKKRMMDPRKEEETYNGGNPSVASKDVFDHKNRSLSDLPGYDILSANERRLCLNLKLTPAQYISVKTSLLTQYLQKKRGGNNSSLHTLGLDKNNRKIIFNFLMKAGWINAY